MKNILILFFICSSCSLFKKSNSKIEKDIEINTQQKVFLVSYDKVWKAAHTALKYTIASENQDFGTIETDYIKSVDGWQPPYAKPNSNSGSRYKLFFTFAKGQTQGKESTRVSIEKKIEKFKNIISDTEVLVSDGSEEKSLFYRIERELIIDQALIKSTEKK